MNQNSEMTRWTMPTNPEFYALHKGAIKIYGATILFMQAVWLFFSVSPFASLLSSNIQAIAPYAIFAAGIGLFCLHYVLHELLRYVAFNLLDNDPNTVNSPMHYVVIALITVAMFALDLQGTTRFLRKADDFKSERTAESAAHRSDLDKTTARQTAELSTLKATHKEEIQAVFDRFAAPLTAIKNRKCYDDFDVKKRGRDYEAKITEMHAAVASLKSKYADIERTTLAQHTTERNRLTSNVDNRVQSIDAADQANAENSESYGWGVSLVCLLVLLAATYQATFLRVKSGQKPVSRFTIADATGSTTSKAADVVSDIWQRKTHQWLAEFHGWATSETRELDTLDGAFKLKGGKYEVQDATPPPPTTPPLSNNNPTTPPTGGGGNGGGGNNPPQSPTAPPTGGNALAAPIVREADVAVAEIKRQFQRFTTLPENTRVNIALDLSRDFQLPYVDMERILTEIDPECSVVNDTLGFIETEHFGELGMAVGNLKNAQRAAFQPAPTPSVVEEKTDAPVTTNETDLPVVTANTSVVTDKEPQTEFSYGDNLLKSLKQKFQKDLNNLKTGNGVTKSIMERLLTQSKEFDIAVRDVKATFKVKTEICEWVGENVQPLISEYLKNGKEVNND